jgi:16S rRNA C967 or C1407 C5-methylase (RsmB/RsmF family)/NOL1/NOP2/fmu family ribosome biogenesis protein
VQIPQQLIDSLDGIAGFDKQSFENVHAFPEQVTSIRINPFKKSMVNGDPMTIGWSIGCSPTHDSPLMTHVPWTEHGHYLSRRPSFTFDPLFHAGCYYVQEASSMFLEQALKQTIDLSKPIRILDLCAAPGGKSTHIQSLITKDSLLVSNEVIKSRANILKDNIIKWGNNNVVVTNNDPADFAKLENYFDVIVIDAPCSGSGLFRRDEEAIAEWSLNNVALCSQRQQRILADTWPALKPGGVLIYSTCSYSKKEDEEILDWIANEFAPDSYRDDSLQLAVDKEWNILEIKSQTGSYGYRFWPDKVKGEGFFIGCFRKAGEEENFSLRVKNKAEFATKKDISIVRPWLTESDHVFVKHNNIVYAIPSALAADVNLLLTTLRVQYSGIIVGEIFGDKMAPAHALAMSNLVNKTIPHTVTDYENAIQYLKKKEFNAGTKDIGWQLVKYEGFNLGWIKVLANRSNNYYPKELRILKDK